MLINSCGWDIAKYFIFSENVFDPLIYYSHLTPFFFALFTGIFLFFGNREKLLNKIFIFLTISLCIWIIFDLILWATEKTEYTMFFWSLLVFPELLIYASAYYFMYVFVKKYDLPFVQKMVLSLFFVPLIFLSSTQYNLQYFDLTNCDREAIEGSLWYYTYIAEAIFTFLILILSIRVFLNKKEERRKIFYISTGILLFLFSFSWGNISGSLFNDWSIGQYGLFGIPIFIIFIGYSIIKFNVFDIKLIGAQALVMAQLVLIGSMLFFATLTISRILIGVTLFGTSIAGWFLIRSVKKEIAQKEQYEKLSHTLAIANEKLKELDTTKSEFISIASHQLRTPLTAIKGYLSLLLEGSYGSVSSQVSDVLNKLYLVNNRLVHLVEDLLNVSRIEAGRIQYNFEPTQIEPIIVDLVEMFKSSANDKHLTLDIHLPEKTLPLIVVDPNKIKEVVSNLIDNSIKYTKVGGTKVTIESTALVVRIIIADTGIGIHPEDMKNLFQKFLRSKETTKMVVSGAGLGLYVGKSFIDAHGGKIWAESDGPDKGSRFIIELPIHNDTIKIGTSDQPTNTEKNS